MTAFRLAFGGAALQALACFSGLPAQNAFFIGAQPISELNTPAGSSNFSPTLTEDELYMVFASTRPGGQGGFDLYETSRPNVDALWSSPVNLSLLNSVAGDYEPNISYTGLEMYFVSTRTGGLGASDIYRTQRPSTFAPWGPPINIGPPVNGPGIANDDPYLTQDGLRMFYTGPGAGGADVLVTTRPSIGAPWQPPQPFAPANSTSFDHSPVVDGSGNTVWFASNRAGGPLGSSDWYMTYRDPVTMTYSTAVPIADISSTDWDSNGWHGGVTGRFYVSQFVGANSFLWRVCPRLVTIWIEECLLSACIPHIQIFPPRVWWDRVWLVSIQVPVVVIEYYRWFTWPLGGFCLLYASLNTGPDIPASLIIPGGEGTVILGGSIINVGATFHPPNTPTGLASYSLGLVPNPAFIGLSIHFQEVGLELNNHLTISEAGTITLTN